MSEKGLSSNADFICYGWENKYFLPLNLSIWSVSCHSSANDKVTKLSIDLKQTQKELKQKYNCYCINYSDVTMQKQCRLAAECNPM